MACASHLPCMHACSHHACSIAFFVTLDWDAVVCCLPIDGAPKWPPIQNAAYIQGKYDVMLRADHTRSEP